MPVAPVVAIPHDHSEPFTDHVIRWHGTVTEGRGLVDAPGRGLVDAKGEYPLCAACLPIDVPNAWVVTTFLPFVTLTMTALR